MMVGGQAVLEGVMMRSPSNWAVSVRRPDGRISDVDHEITSVAAKRRWLRLPVIRGVVALGESLAIGMRALSVSAQYAATDEGDEDPSEALGKGYIIGSIAFAVVFSILLFKVSPALLAGLVADDTLIFLILEGATRIGLLIAYLVVISMIPDLKRVFQYHAAEHKTINAYEAGDDLQPEIVQRHSLIHVRCGTAFLLWVMVVAIIVFAFVGKPDWPLLILSRIVALPLIAGIAYEVIRLAARFGDNPFVKVVMAPGLWLQRLTTRQPSLDQIEVAIQSLKKVLDLEERRRVAGADKVEVMA